ncbi:MAG TPA: class I SAM-dependent methyltransferase [Acetobacteraceae bacterium]|jgi:sarcosine/dimethylglycine N-methyltransferase|nr:class I SAM-dependent methyltransferase [Acetobacteraceae bacterium]
MSTRVEDHYANPDIVPRILAALRQVNGPDEPITPDALAPLDHFHGRGVVATREMAAMLKPQPGDHVLDIGSGIGGPARWIASQFGCRVTGVDLTQAFCDAAIELNNVTGMADRVRILQGNALALPLPDDTLDRAYSQNVVMNIADKRGMYREALRVLKPGGVLALSNVCAGANGEPYFPVPWAATAATSFLSTPDATHEDLLAVGFEIIEFRETTQSVLADQIKDRKRMQTRGLPPLGIHLIIGDRAREYRINSARSLEDGRTATIEALVRKPG